LNKLKFTRTIKTVLGMGIQMAVKYSSTALTHLCSLLGVED